MKIKSKPVEIWFCPIELTIVIENEDEFKSLYALSSLNEPVANVVENQWGIPVNKMRLADMLADVHRTLDLYKS